MTKPIIGATVAVLGVSALLAYASCRQEKSVGATSTSSMITNLTFSPQARRYLISVYQAYSTEFMGCMIGKVSNDTVKVSRIALVYVDSSHSTKNHVVPTQSCEEAGWLGTVGIIHNHIGGESCWYYFPGTQVLGSDGESFLRQQYPVDAIMCGEKVVWIDRSLKEKVIWFEKKPAPATTEENRRGNKTPAEFN